MILFLSSFCKLISVPLKKKNPPSDFSLNSRVLSFSIVLPLLDMARTTCCFNSSLRFLSVFSFRFLSYSPSPCVSASSSESFLRRTGDLCCELHEHVVQKDSSGELCDTVEWSQWLREWKKREMFFRSVQARVKQIARQKRWASFPLRWIWFAFVLNVRLPYRRRKWSKIGNATPESEHVGTPEKNFPSGLFHTSYACLYSNVIDTESGWGNFEQHKQPYTITLKQLQAKIMLRLVLFKLKAVLGCVITAILYISHCIRRSQYDLIRILYLTVW